MEDRGLLLKGEITMMKMMKNFMNKQWTWGTYFKLCGIVYGLCAAVVAITVAIDKYQERKEQQTFYEAKTEEYEF